MRMSGHVAGGEKGYQRTDSGDDQGKQETEAVQAEAQPDVEAGHPGPFHGVHATFHHQGPQGAKRGKQQHWQGRRDKADAAIANHVG